MFDSLRKKLSREGRLCNPNSKLPPSEKCILRETASLNQKIDKTLLDYKKHNNCSQAYQELVDVNQKINVIFDRLQKYSVNDNELEALTRLCRRVNEDPNIIQIQERTTGKKWKTEKSGSLDLLDSQAFSKSEPSTMDSLDGQDNTRMSRSSKLSTGYEEKGSHLAYSERMEVKLLKGQSDIWNLENEEPEDEEVVESGYKAEFQFSVETEQRKIVKQVEQPKVEVYDPNKKLQQEFEGLLAKLKEAYYEHEVDKAYRTLEALREFTQIEGRAEFAAKLHEPDTLVLIRDTEKIHKEMVKTLKELEDDEGYHEEPTKKNYTIKFKKIPGGKVSLKMEATVDASLLNLLRLFYEADGYKMWAPFCKESKQIKKLCKAANYIKLRWDFPPPLSSREGYMIGCGIVRLEENGSFLLIAKTVHDDKQLQERFELDVPAHSKKVRLDIHYVGVELVPITETRTKMKIVAMFDPKIKVIPANFMSFIVRKGSKYLLDKIITCAKELETSDWRDLQDNREFYSWLDTLLIKQMEVLKHGIKK